MFFKITLGFKGGQTVTVFEGAEYDAIEERRVSLYKLLTDPIDCGYEFTGIGDTDISDEFEIHFNPRHLSFWSIKEVSSRC